MLLSISVSHRTADFDLLDRLSAATAAHAAEMLLTSDVHGAVLLSTCNRIEAYLDVPAGADERGAESVIEVLAAATTMPLEELRPSIAVAAGPDALRHLFAVTSGLESLAVGEDEIAGQVRRAYDEARSAGTTTPELDRAFQRAAKVSREVRAATELGARGRSLVQFALRLASARVTDWRAARVLVVGTGNYAATTIQSLRSLGVLDLSVFSATGRAESFADRYSIRAVHDLAAALAQAEVIVTCTRAYTIAPELLPADGARRLVVDLGLPRNVAPEVAQLPGIELLDLELIAAHRGMPELDPDAVPERDARGLVEDAAGRYTAERLAAPAVVALRRHVFDALDAEIARAEARPGGADTVEALRHLAGVLLHTPSERARELAAAGAIADFEAALATVFGIDAAPREEHPVTPLRTASGTSSAASSARSSGP